MPRFGEILRVAQNDKTTQDDKISQDDNGSQDVFYSLNASGAIWYCLLNVVQFFYT